MGAYAPLPWAPPGLVDEVLATVLQPTVDEMRRRGTPFAGLLYAGLALTSRGVRVIEFNARFGDPETQVVLAAAGDPAGRAAARRGDRHARRRPAAALARRRRGDGRHRRRTTTRAPRAPATPIDRAPDGRRTSCTPAPPRPPTARSSRPAAGCSAVTATGPDLAAARQAAYERVAGIRLDGAHYRTDIALAAVEGRIEVPRP